MPDHEVIYTVDELLVGTDKDLEVALRLARAASPPLCGQAPTPAEPFLRSIGR